MDKIAIAEQINNYSEHFLSELCFYGLIDAKFNPKPKLVNSAPKKNISPRHDNIIKIIADDQLFEISESFLSRSTYFNNKLKISRDKRFYLSNTYSYIFRYVLNFLRTDELYIDNNDILEMLNFYGIQYDKIQDGDNNSNHTLIPCLNTSTIHAINYQMSEYINLLGTNVIDNKYYCPNASLTSFGVENMNIITTESKLLFDSEIIFNLSNNDYGE